MGRKVACVVGGTSGIGRAAVLHFLGRGWHVVAVGRREEHAAELKAAVPEADHALTVLVADMCQWRSAEDLATVVGRLDGCDLLVNAAGSVGSGGVEHETLETWARVVETNLNPMFFATKALLPLLKRRKGSVINISSVCSFRPCASISYSVSKAGVDMFTRVAAKELAPYGVRVNCINPSVVRTNLHATAGLFETEDDYSAWIDTMTTLHPLGRIGETDDIVAALDYLAGDGASWVTGAILAVDGGRGVA